MHCDPFGPFGRGGVPGFAHPLMTPLEGAYLQSTTTTYLPMPQQLPLCTTFLFPTTLSLFMSLQIPPPLESPNHHAPATHTLRELAFNHLHVLSTIIYRLSASLAHLGITSKRLTTQTYLPNPLLAQVAVLGVARGMGHMPP